MELAAQDRILISNGKMKRMITSYSSYCPALDDASEMRNEFYLADYLRYNDFFQLFSQFLYL